MSSTPARAGPAHRDETFRAAVAEFGPMLHRIAAAYESDPDRRHDLRQEIHLQLWKSLAAFDSRCSLKTWILRVAHNTAVSYVSRENRWRSRLVSLEEHEDLSAKLDGEHTLDRTRALDHLYALIHSLKPLDRQVILSWLEGMDAAAIAEITGLSPANIAMKIHRIKTLLTRRFHQEHLCPTPKHPAR